MELHGPIQGRLGELDKNPPADEMRKLDAELKRLGKPHEFYFYRTQAMLSIEKAGKVPA